MFSLLRVVVAVVAGTAALEVVEALAALFLATGLSLLQALPIPLRLAAVERREAPLELLVQMAAIQVRWG
jgi:hypothetical protein